MMKDVVNTLESHPAAELGILMCGRVKPHHSQSLALLGETGTEILTTKRTLVGSNINNAQDASTVTPISILRSVQRS